MLHGVEYTVRIFATNCIGNSDTVTFNITSKSLMSTCMVDSIIAKRLSVRHLILLRSWFVFVYMYVLCIRLSHFNCCVGDVCFGGLGAVSMHEVNTCVLCF